MPRYVFQLDRMHVNNQRGKRPDKDVITFGVQVGAQKYALVRLIDRQFPDPPGDPFPGAAEGVVSGDTIEFGLAPPPNPRRRWEIGPIEIANDDDVLVSFTAVNASDASGGVSDKQAIQVGLGVLDTIAGAVGSVVATPVAGVAAAAISAVVGDIISNLIPDAPKCNGLVAGYTWSWNGSALTRAVQAAEGHLPLLAERVENPDIPAECGHPGNLDVFASVRLVEPVSVKEFLGPVGDLSRGVFALSPVDRSVRNLVERWSWTQPLEA